MLLSETTEIDPVEWGWEIKREKLHPIMIELSPAPDNFLALPIFPSILTRLYIYKELHCNIDTCVNGRQISSILYIVFS